MIANATAHRRANAFAQALDEQGQVPDAIDGTATGVVPSQDRPGVPKPRNGQVTGRDADPLQGRMLALTEELGGLPSPGLAPETKAVQRAQLMAAVETAFAGGSLAPEKVVLPRQRDRRASRSHRASAPRLGRFRPRSRWGRRLAAGGLAIGVVAGGFSGAAAASSEAVPGDTLYGLKRGIEDLQLTMADGDADRGEVYLDLASTRLKETRRLLEHTKARPLDRNQVAEVRRTLTGMHSEAAEGHRLLSQTYHRSGSLAPIQKLASFADEHRTQWAQLSPRIPDQLSEERAAVSGVLEAIAREVVPLRPLLPGAKAPLGGSGGRHRDGELPSVPGGIADPPEAPGEQPAPEQSGGHDKNRLPGSADVPDPADKDGDGGPPEPSAGSGDLEPSLPREDKPGKEVTLPPLLPGLLPGTDLDTGGD